MDQAEGLIVRIQVMSYDSGEPLLWLQPQETEVMLFDS